ncbi:MAG: phytoene/squalene synthase family protein [Melioribacteraceae bacterium]|nr:phytoene/squalene synthase family protein [Melioribacteraceae bacterium]
MNLQDYNKLSYKLSKDITHAYSTSFGWGIKAFSTEYRDPIYAVYGFVRIADEIVDTFYGYDKKKLLNDFRRDTYAAIEEGISTNPILNSFAAVVREYNIDIKLVESFLKSMEMDLYENSYERNDYDEYIHGSAEVVGLMCLKVFAGGNQQRYDELVHPARMLGSAFQKVNFLRDIKSDLSERGRIYLPDVHHNEFIDNINKQKLENEIEEEFAEALKGIRKLPIGVKIGVYSAYLYYLILFKKIKRLDVKELMKRRVRVSNIQKLVLLLKSVIEVKVLRLT